eukprot:1398166-Amphidinium_carterae.1
MVHNSIELELPWALPRDGQRARTAPNKKRDQHMINNVADGVQSTGKQNAAPTYNVTYVFFC